VRSGQEKGVVWGVAGMVLRAQWKVDGGVGLDGRAGLSRKLRPAMGVAVEMEGEYEGGEGGGGGCGGWRTRTMAR